MNKFLKTLSILSLIYGVYVLGSGIARGIDAAQSNSQQVETR